MTCASRTLQVTDPADDGRRADVVLGRRMPGLSRRMARRMALDGHVRLDGRRIPPSARVRLGQVLEIVWSVHEPGEEPDESVEILAVTDDYVFAAKPAGMHTHRLRPDQPAALADYVARLHPECATASPDPREGGAVHRLDLETSGVVVFARHRKAWTAAREAFSRGAVAKRYLAICHAPPSWPPTGPSDLPGFVRPDDDDAVWVEAPIGRGPRRDRAAVSLRGPSARTRVRRVCTSPDGRYVLTALDLVTGRRHQARVHLAFLDMPIVGDVKYGPSDEIELPLLLHGTSIDLSPLAPKVEAPPSDAFVDFLAAHGMGDTGPASPSPPP